MTPVQFHYTPNLGKMGQNGPKFRSTQLLTLETTKYASINDVAVWAQILKIVKT